MDPTAERITRFCLALDEQALTEDVLRPATNAVVDSVGCAIGALDSPPVRIARALAADARSGFGATALGLPRPTSAELATFVNTIAVRYLDFNDTYFGPHGGGGHPSDLVPTAIALGEATGASGRELLLLVTLGYEVLGTLASAVRLRERGWDQGLYAGLAAAVMTGKALDLDLDRLGNAVALAVTPHVPTRQTRAGALSMWKGAATAEAARNGVFAGRLAALGMTGPPRPFEGEHGIWDQVSGPFELSLPARPDSFVVQNCHTKTRPAEYNSQGLLDIAVELAPVLDIDAVEAIHVDTYWLGYSEIGREPEKWDPPTRETADHSIPYLLARTLVDGELGLGSFADDKVADPGLRPLMRKITVAENVEYTARFSAELPVHVDVRLRDGTHLVRESLHPRGHARNPLTRGELDRKFAALVASRSPGDVAVSTELRLALDGLADVPDVRKVFRALGELRAPDEIEEVRP